MREGEGREPVKFGKFIILVMSLQYAKGEIAVVD